jgi:hypothetical protein
MSVSVAASAGPVLPIPGWTPLLEPLFRCRMTPEPCLIIWRAAARAVTKLATSPLVTARERSAAVMSISGVPCTSPVADEVVAIVG